MDTATQRWTRRESEDTRAVLLQTAPVCEPGVLLKTAARHRAGTRSASRRIAGSKSGRTSDVLLQAAPVRQLQAAEVTFKCGNGVMLKTASQKTTGGRNAGSEPAQSADRLRKALVAQLQAAEVTFMRTTGASWV
jgi:hypothetical protein